MKIKTLLQAQVKNKRVLVRVDFNVPLQKNRVSDDTRIKRTLPTLKYLLKQKSKIILITHLGRPDGKKTKDLQLDAIAKHLSKLLKKPVKKLDDCIGPKVEKSINVMKPGQIILLENIRFHKEEETNDKAFTKKLAALGEVFINESFATAHRKHASTYGLAKFLPTYAGLLMEEEIKTLSAALNEAKRPLTVIVGGAKIDTKIGVIKSFLGKADYFIIGGGLANTFLAAEGFDIGDSLYEKNKLKLAQEIMLKSDALKESFILPEDVVVADEISVKAKTLDLPVEDVMGGMKILDIGKKTLKKYEAVIKKSATIIWNGPVGLFEYKPFSQGTLGLAKMLAKTKAKVIVGGGDTVEAMKQFGISEKKYDFVSTGGGAMLEFLEGTTLPGVEVVLEK